MAVDKYSASAVVYFTESAADKIGVYENSGNGFVTDEYSLPPGSQPLSIVQGPPNEGRDNFFWFTEPGTNMIGRIDETTHVITQYPVPTPDSQPWGITASATTIYFTESAGNKIGRITFTNGKPDPITEIALPTNGSTPLGITAGSHGQVWFAEETGNQLGLYDDTTVPTFTVTSAADSGAGTLRTAIEMADMPANAGSTINFNIPGGAQKISLQAPAANHRANDDRRLHPAWDWMNQNGPTANTNAVLLIEITTADPAVVTNGLDITAGGGSSVIEGLAINGFTMGAGIEIEGGAGTAVQGDFIGVTANGDATTGNMFGVEITAAASSTTIGGITPGDRNLISGNLQHGIYVHGSSGNTIVNNLIGTDKSGTGAIANQRGIFLDSNASFNTIGGGSLSLNVISGNTINGVELAESNNDTIEGNYIGSNATGLAADANGGSGVVLDPSNNTSVIGNVISGNLGKLGGLLIGFGGGISSDTLVTGNRIGVGYNGATLIPNATPGIEIDPFTGTTTIGGTYSYDRNIIAGNGGDGILVDAKNDAAHPIDILGNWVGAYRTGMPSDGNAKYGVEVESGIVNIGGTAMGAGNVISGNAQSGIDITAPVGSATTVRGNLIGLDPTGTFAIPNAGLGVLLNDSTGGNTIGGTATGAGNVVSGNKVQGIGLLASPHVFIADNIVGLSKDGDQAVPNQGAGILVNDSNDASISGNLISGNGPTGGGLLISSTSSGTLVTGNTIGLNKAGTQAVPNAGNGVSVDGTTTHTTIGGTAKGDGNIISGNAGPGVLLQGPATVLGNFIGTSTNGNAFIANTGDGIQVFSGGCTVGGTLPSDRNIIAGNGGDGILVDAKNAAADPINILGNYVGAHQTGVNNGGNAMNGVEVKSGIVNIGGPAMGAGNVISGNAQSGIDVTAPAGSSTTVQGNLIGLDPTGTLAIPNVLQGVFLDGSKGVNIIGGTAAGTGNLISGNTEHGIALDASPNVTIASNIIGLNKDGDQAVPNTGNGIQVNSSSGVSIRDNLISGNGQLATGGVHIGGNSSGTLVTGNTIGLNKAGTQAVPNLNGVVVEATTTNTTIGGTANGARNIISGNAGAGVLLKGPATVQGNFIGTDKNGNASIANGADGIQVSSGGSTIGGNTISGNTGAGIAIMKGGDGNQIIGNDIGTDSNGASAVPNAIGVSIAGAKNELTQNVVSGNTGDGIVITGDSNTVGANLVGVTSDGATELGNGGNGVQVAGGMKNVIGVPFTSNGANLVVAGNAGAGVLVDNASSTLIQGSYIGTDKNNTEAIPNASGGVIVSTEAVDTTVGGTANGDGNIIAGNSDVDGVRVGSNASGTLLQGNRIGGAPASATASASSSSAPLPARRSAAQRLAPATSSPATACTASACPARHPAPSSWEMRSAFDSNGDANGNGKEGILIDGGKKTTIGGPGGNISPSRNVISGNLGNGITVTGGTGLLILGNLVGTSVDGKNARPNGGAGIEIDKGASAAIGTADAKNPSNEISGNTGPGILLNGATGVSIVNNDIGLTNDPTAPFGNANGIQVLDSNNTTIGGVAAGAGNFIAANKGDGIQVGGTTSGTLIEGNLIGPDRSQYKYQANTGNGINVTGAATSTRIGGTENGAGNIISGNKLNGIYIDVNTTGNLIQGNNIGLNLTADKALGNGQDGVHVLGRSVTIGGTVAGSRNLISGNAGNGVYLDKTASSGIVQGNFIGTDKDGNNSIRNGANGVQVLSGSVTIGGANSGARNVISGNNYGVWVNAASAVTVLGNFIGTNEDGTKKLGNTIGVEIDGSSMVTIGGTVAGSRNLISGNLDTGIRTNNDTQITILGNLIGTGIYGDSILGNGNSGIYITGNTTGTTIGDTGGHFNVISGNGNAGIAFGAGATDLTVLGNFIGTDKGGNIKLPNKIGVLLYGTTFQIGGPNLAKAPMQGNVISGNTTYGIEVSATAGTQEIVGNDIGTNQSGNAKVGNRSDGVYIVNATGVMLGMNGQGNVISGNRGSGVRILQSQNITVEGNQIGTDPAGIANARDGVRLDHASSSTVVDNLIAGNGSGVVLTNASNHNVINANTIGTDPSLTENWGNRQFGVLVNGTSNQNTITSNVIAFNSKGVVVGSSPSDNSNQDSLLGNSIFRNKGLGIALGNDGVTRNSSPATDGPNNLQHFPVLSQAALTGGKLTISGNLTSSANHTYRVEFFVQDTAGKTRYGQGKTFIGSVDVMTDSNGHAVIQISFDKAGVSAGQGITATATDLGPVTGPPSGTEGNTSEFSKGVVVS